MNLGAIERQPVTGLFRDELFGLRLDDAGQGQPDEQDHDNQQAGKTHAELFQQGPVQGEFHCSISARKQGVSVE